MSCPDIAILGQSITFTIQARSGDGSPVDADSLPTYKIYEETTNTEIVSGTMAKLDDTDTDGYYAAKIDTTTALGYENLKTYTIRVETAISGIDVVKTFSFIVLGEGDILGTSDALTTTANFKAYKGITSTDDDTLIGYLISRATSAIQRYTGRDFISTTYREILDGYGQCEINLKQYPVTAIRILAIGREDAFDIINTSSDAYNARVSINDTQMILEVMGGTNDGTETLTLASYDTLSDLFAAISALDKGWSIIQQTQLNYWSPEELLPTGKGLACLNTYTSLQIPEEPEEEFAVDNSAGILKYFGRFSTGFQNIIVRYTAGYSTIPADLEQICIDLVASYYDTRQTDSTMRREKIGDYEYERGDSSASSTSMPVGIQQRLNAWKAWA